MWTIRSHSGLGGIVGVLYFSQVSWPVSLFVFSHLPNHLHNGLIRPLHQHICLGVVRHGLQLLHTKEFTHLISNAAHEVSTPITQAFGWGPKDSDVTLIQEPGECLSCLMGVTYAITCFVKWSWNTRTLATLGGLFSSRVISMLVKSTCTRSIRVVATIGCRGALDKLPSCCKQCAQDVMDCCIWLAMPGHQKCSHNKGRV